MKAACPSVTLFALGLLSALPGCFVPRAHLSACQSQNRILTEQCRAQLAEIENLKIHSRNTADQLRNTEEELSLLQEETGLDRSQLVKYQQERAELHKQLYELVDGHVRIPPEVSRRLAELSEQYPSLDFDPRTGVSKLDTDVLFDSGSAELKLGAERMLAELCRVFNSPEASDLKVLVAGHTDDRRIAKRPAREKYPNNFHLSSARALAVADSLRRQGFPEHRMGVAGFGPYQPVAPNASPMDRQKNRRVEIFVMNRTVPVIGWADSMPSVY
ncbi:MAG: OmpA family protein [Pirellulales bacterium]|nr:OmpA family protein [Pirellulales bacterium]